MLQCGKYLVDNGIVHRANPTVKRDEAEETKDRERVEHGDKTREPLMQLR